MNRSAALKFKKITINEPDLAKVISLSMGQPTQSKIKKVFNQYHRVDHALVGCFLEKSLIGVIGLQLNKTQAQIQHLSVLKKHQRQGIGQALIDYVIESFHLNSIIAKTDEDAVGFYRSLGFVCQELKKYDNRMRYQCSKQVL